MLVPSSGSPPTARGAATRARIIQAAADLVRASGVAGTSLDEVLAASGTSKSQLYHYFADKDDLILAVIDFQTRRVLSAQEPLFHQLHSLAGLRRWADAVVRITREHACAGGCPIGSLASELGESPRPRALLAESFRRWEFPLVVGLTAMRDQGELNATASPENLATAVIAALEGGLLLSQITRDTRPLELALNMALEHVAIHRR
jgi:AcrR family transcriptional regulator